MANMMAWLANHPRVLPERVIRGAFLAAADVAWLLRVGSVRQLERNLSHVLTWSCARPDAAGAQPTPVDAKALRRRIRRSPNCPDVPSQWARTGSPGSVR